MPVLDQDVGPWTLMGATLVASGATFRTWAPHALDVYLVDRQGIDAAASEGAGWSPTAADRLTRLEDGTWVGYVPGVGDGHEYLFWVRGPGTTGFKRDPYAHELGLQPPFPDCPCIVRAADAYPWRVTDWSPPTSRDLVIYQLHIGTFSRVDHQGRDQRRAYGRFLDVIGKLPYLRDLGVTAVQFLPVQEYDREVGLGYNGLDYFSPEMAYQVEDPEEIAWHLEVANGLLAAANRPPLELADLMSGPNQLKCLVDLCHLSGLAVVFDLVYNHAGGGFGDRSLAFYDRQVDDGTPWERSKATLYFGNGEHAGGLVFDYDADMVRQLLIDNARFFLDAYRIDGIRYDQVGVATMHAGGTRFFRDLTDTLHFHRASAIQIAEYWEWDRAQAVTPTKDGGLGGDAALADGLRDALWAALSQAAHGRDAILNLDRVAAAFRPPAGFPDAWRAVQNLETHDEVLWNPFEHTARNPRIAKRADPSPGPTWHARSRSRVATTLLLTAPGIPMLFMGQEFLEEKPWSDDVANWPEFLIGWDWLTGDALYRHRRDFHRFVTDLLHLRQGLPGLRGEGVHVLQVHNLDRVIVVHRWVEGEGRDVVVIASLNESTLDGYPIEMPWPGPWREVFNSDLYDHFPNPWVVGNGGSIVADGPAGRDYACTARVRLPANAALIFTRGA
ncbi:MAG: alpha amylase C-terminal domain-containing protein [Geminicoccaceae bacterium]